MLSKDLRKTYAFTMADLQAQYKQEVKAKAELQMSWPSVEGVLQQRANAQRREIFLLPPLFFSLLFSFSLSLFYWFLAFKEISIKTLSHGCLRGSAS